MFSPKQPFQSLPFQSVISVKMTHVLSIPTLCNYLLVSPLYTVNNDYALRVTTIRQTLFHLNTFALSIRTQIMLPQATPCFTIEGTVDLSHLSSKDAVLQLTLSNGVSCEVMFKLYQEGVILTTLLILFPSRLITPLLERSSSPRLSKSPRSDQSSSKENSDVSSITTAQILTWGQFSRGSRRLQELLKQMDDSDFDVMVKKSLPTLSCLTNSTIICSC